MSPTCVQYQQKRRVRVATHMYLTLRWPSGVKWKCARLPAGVEETPVCRTTPAGQEYPNPWRSTRIPLSLPHAGLPESHAYIRRKTLRFRSSRLGQGPSLGAPIEDWLLLRNGVG